MSGRHRRVLERALPNRRVAGAGAVGVAAVFAAAPFAHAEAAPAPGGDPATTQSDAATPKVSARTAVEVVPPNFGFQKIRVGVQVKSGAFVPAGTTTAGSEVTITETGPHVDGIKTTTCTTDASTAETGSTATHCVFQSTQRQVALALDIPSEQLYTAQPGDTVIVRQTTVEPNLRIDPEPRTIEPCLLPAVPNSPVCDTTATAVFSDPGLPPQARNDDAGVVSPGGPVEINVLRNDTTKQAPATITIAHDPAHGTAEVVQAPGAAARALKAATHPVIRYTPDAGFAGRDSFTYTLTTANGSSTATVSVLVTPPPTAKDDTATTDTDTAVTIAVLGNDDANGGGALTIRSVGDPGHGTVRIDGGKVVYTPDTGFGGSDTFTYVATTAAGSDTATVTVTVGSGVANTGSQTEQLAGLAALLLVTGGAATAAGRRRYRARHAVGV
jgi:hypothetical protein